ncbi:MAG TPA: OsmC family protein [Streptosporangiaceae bacterium]|nr:OsmC family protein [Streptosporangiaceae bacterium]
MGNLRTVRLEWLGKGLRFRAVGTEPATPAIEIDGDGDGGPSPTIALLMAAGGCTGSDVVSILQKMRVQLAQVVVEVSGERREEQPRRFVSVHYRYRISGEGVDQDKAERAVTLSLEKYCSVLASLAPDIKVTHEVVLE